MLAPDKALSKSPTMRETSYAGGGQQTSWRNFYDEAGRLESKERLVPGGDAVATSFDWFGELYLGRTQDQPGHPSPFREQRIVDPFGRTLTWRYTAIDVDQNGNPLDGAEGINYCGLGWDSSQCARPLLHIDLLRDVMGRVASLKTRFGSVQ